MKAATIDKLYRAKQTNKQLMNIMSYMKGHNQRKDRSRGELSPLHPLKATFPLKELPQAGFNLDLVDS